MFRPTHGDYAMENDVDRRTLTDAEAARYIGMSGSWLRQARMNGNPDAPPYIKIGRSVRYLREDLDTWLEQRRRVSTSDPGPTGRSSARD